MIALVASAHLLWAGQEPAASSGIVVRDAWVRESTATRTVSSGYLTIENRTGREVKLVRLAVDGAGRAELHEIVRDGAQSHMRPATSLRIPPNGAVGLAPGGTHVMLFDVNPPFVRGKIVTMTLTFDDGRSEKIRAVVRPLSAMSPR
jgi:copper(I)-binding protein